MTKIVVNKQYGGFGLSKEAFIEFCKRSNYRVTSLGDYFRYIQSLPYSEIIMDYDSELDEKYDIKADRDIPRDNPILVAIVEESDDNSVSGRFADLQITEIPDDVEWEIQEYDGMEWVAEKHRTW